MAKNSQQRMNTSQEYYAVISECRALFEKKMHDYGSAWRILRAPSMTDQIFIKVSRIRNFEISGVQKVDEDIRDAFIAIVNYSIMALIQLELSDTDKPDLSVKQALEFYDKYTKQAHDLMMDKNHDYGEAWREFHPYTFVDLILQTTLRIKSIDSLDGKTLASEGIDDNYFDMINYAVFALIKM
jgi:D-mannonate dehydratase